MVIGAKTFRLIIVNRLHTRQQTLWAGRKNAATFFSEGGGIMKEPCIRGLMTVLGLFRFHRTHVNY